jgi:hypothetical protein
VEGDPRACRLTQLQPGPCGWGAYVPALFGWRHPPCAGFRRSGEHGVLALFRYTGDVFAETPCWV